MITKKCNCVELKFCNCEKTQVGDKVFHKICGYGVVKEIHYQNVITNNINISKQVEYATTQFKYEISDIQTNELTHIIGD